MTRALQTLKEGGLLRRPNRPGRAGREDDAKPAPVPDAVEVAPGWVAVGDPTLEPIGGREYSTTFAVTGWPAEVTAGWWEPLLTWSGRLDLTLHLDPIPPATAAHQLKRARTRLEATRRGTAEHDRLDDPEVDAAAQDAADLAARVARGDGRLINVGAYLRVRAHTEHALAEAVAEVRGICAGMLLTVVPVTWRQLAGFTTTLPLGIDGIGAMRVMHTDALATLFPFGTPDLPIPPQRPALPPSRALPAGRGSAGGVFWGFNLHTPGPVVWDRWAQPNHNAVILAASGAGKSYLAKLDLARELYTGASASVIDPDGEYRPVADWLGGTVVALGAPGVSLNPLDVTDRRPDALARRALFVHGLVEVLLGAPLTALARGLLDRAIRDAYAAAGYRPEDPRTWVNPAPVLADVARRLAHLPSDEAAVLATQLDPYVTGSSAGLFGPSTVRIDPRAPLVVHDLSQLPEELTAAGMLLTLDAVWARLTDPRAHRVRKLALVDEAWRLLQQPAGARFLHRAARAARKHYAGLTVITQDVADVLATELGRTVINNAATRLFLRQAPETFDALVHECGLSEVEAGWLQTAGRGEALLAAGARRVVVNTLAGPVEHAVFVTGIDHR